MARRYPGEVGMRLAVVGAGAWGTALASSFANDHQVVLHGRDAALLEEISLLRENRRYLPGCVIAPALAFEADFARAVEAADWVIVATPLSGLRPVVRELARGTRQPPVLWACKGFEAGSSRLAHQVVSEELGHTHPGGVLTGPSFASEVARGLPTALSFASLDAKFAEQVCLALHQPRLRIYANLDLIGAEVGGAVKNVMAIAVGIAEGMGFGLNARAALMTRGLAEIARLGLALGAKRDSFLGLAGMGDLILTCTGDLSRNRAVGLALARGESLDQILAQLGHVAEGVSTTRETARLARSHGVDMPITQAMQGILFEGLSAEKAVERLLTREPRAE